METIWNTMFLQIGRQGENGARVIRADVSQWLEAYPSGEVVLFVTRPTELTPYIPDGSSVADGILSWTVSGTDTGIAGTGRAELRLMDGDTIVKSEVVRTTVEPCLPGTDSPVPPTPEVTDWVTRFIDSAETVDEALANADAAVAELDAAIAQAGDIFETIDELKNAFGETRTAVGELFSDGATLLSDVLVDKSSTSSSVTFNLVGNVVAVQGTATGTSSFAMLGSTTSAPPEWMVGGRQYILNLVNETPVEVRFQCKTTTQTSIFSFVKFIQSGTYIFTVPDNITVFRIMLVMDSGNTANGTVTLEISNAIESSALANAIDELQDDVSDIPEIKSGYLELTTDYCAAIPDGSDLDTYTNPGTYKVTNNAHARTITNIPIEMAGKLIVLSLSQTARAYQIYSAANSESTIYVRFFNGTTWSGWKKIWYQNIGYVRYTSGSFDSGKATEELDIYQPATVGFIKFVLYHYVNASTSQNYDVWRIYHAYHVDDLSDTNLLDISISGEWECALHLAGRDDFSGGSTHGDEVMQDDIVALRNGKPVNISSFTTLTTFYDFTLIRTSKLYDPADHTTVIADHGVQYKFSTANLTINQSVIWRVADTLTNCFLCMFLPSKDVVDRAVSNSDFKTIVLPSSTSEPLTTITKSKCTAVTMWDTGTGVSAEISVPTYPTGLTGGDQISISDNGGNNYNKLYFKVCGDGASTIGEMWKSTSVYKIDYAT